MKKTIISVISILAIMSMSACTSTTMTSPTATVMETTEQVSDLDATGDIIEGDVTDSDTSADAVDTAIQDEGFIDDADTTATVDNSSEISVDDLDTTVAGNEDMDTDSYNDTVMTSDCCSGYVDYCVLTKDSVYAKYPAVDMRTEEEIKNYLSILTVDEYSALFPTKEDYDIFVSIAIGQGGGIFKDSTLQTIAEASADSYAYFHADCDIIYDCSGYEDIPVVVYYSSTPLLVYNWAVLTADAFDYDAEALKVFCESDYYTKAKATNNSDELKELLLDYGLSAPKWYYE